MQDALESTALVAMFPLLSHLFGEPDIVYNDDNITWDGACSLESKLHCVVVVFAADDFICRATEYLRGHSIASEICRLAQVISNHLLTLDSHKYIAHQLALLYVSPKRR